MNIIHFNTGPTAEYSRVPLCHATAQNGNGWSRGNYTNEVAAVRCRRCLVSLGVQLPNKTAPIPLLPNYAVEPSPF